MADKYDVDYPGFRHSLAQREAELEAEDSLEIARARRAFRLMDAAMQKYRERLRAEILSALNVNSL